jgi:membrane protease YdiL (CAAX protease family)
MAAMLWVAMTVSIHLESRAAEGWGDEGVYLLYVDRELRLMESGEDLSGFQQWIVGADEPLETMIDLRQSMELLAESNEELSPEGSVCLALLQFETGESDAARETLARVEPETTAGWLLDQLLEQVPVDEADLEELRSSVESGMVLAWESRILALADSEQNLDRETWSNHRAVNATMLSRAQLLLVLDGLVFLAGLICLPLGLCELRRRTPGALPRIMGRWTASFVMGGFFLVEIFTEVLASVQSLVGSLATYNEALPYAVWFLMWTIPVLCSQGYEALFLAVILFARPWHAWRAFRISGPVPWAAILGLLTLLSILHYAVFSLLDFERVVDPADFLLLTEVGLLEFGFIFLSGCVAAPVFEEFVYRGVLFLGLRGRMGTVGALVFSTVVFAIAHSQYDWEGILSVGVFGACCGVLAWRTGSILPGIILHAIYNTLIFGNVFVIYQLELRVPW